MTEDTYQSIALVPADRGLRASVAAGARGRAAREPTPAGEAVES